MQDVNEPTQSADPDQGQPPLAPPPRHHFGLALIAIFKLVKGCLLLAAASGLLRMLHSDLSMMVEHWITACHMDPDSRCFHWVLQKVAAISPAQLRAVSAGFFFYSALLLTEGVGLWFEFRWAEYLTVIATSAFIPLEIYELARGVNPTTLIVLAINLAIVWYLVRTLRRERKHKA